MQILEKALQLEDFIPPLLRTLLAVMSVPPACLDAVEGKGGTTTGTATGTTAGTATGTATGTVTGTATDNTMDLELRHTLDLQTLMQLQHGTLIH